MYPPNNHAFTFPKWLFIIIIIIIIIINMNFSSEFIYILINFTAIKINYHINF